MIVKVLNKYHIFVDKFPFVIIYEGVKIKLLLIYYTTRNDGSICPDSH